ncbi:MAG: ATPase [Treponemataceae bacterium]|nr:ATPase [Treponemataceae bacterium]
MAKTTAMKLIELMILKEDIDRVLEFLGKRGNFQFQTEIEENSSASGVNSVNASKEIFDKLQGVRSYLGVEDLTDYAEDCTLPVDADFEKAGQILQAVDELKEREIKLGEEKQRVTEAYEEANAFSNLKVAYKELDHLSFLSLRIGRIDPAMIDELTFAVGGRAVIVPLGEDKTRILAASSKKGRFALDAELKRFGFVGMEVPKDFKGIPDDVLESLKKQKEKADNDCEEIKKERTNYAETHAALITSLLGRFSMGMQVQAVRDRLESTQLVYRIAGWITASDSDIMMKELDELTEGRIAIRSYNPDEVPSVRDGHEKVPVKLTHGKLVSSFERMIFSYGAPLYGTIDPTPFVAFFFTLLFGIMFGDAGQGLVFIIVGILLTTHAIPWFKSWHKFGPVFISIGCSSFIMGLLTGEFFCNEHILEPFGLFVTGLFVGKENAFAPILHMMPSSSTVDKMFMFFLFTIGVGFIINSIGLVINISNNFIMHRKGKAIFGKTGICGTVFFWYIVSMVIRIFAFGSSIQIYDWIVIGLALLGVFFAEPLSRLVDGERPVFENGVFAAVIEGIVELLEVVSSYLSNSVSFLRVGAFALAHAVLGYIIFTLSALIPVSAGGVAVSIIGNAVVIVLEGMIVAIQVIRLQYYEFFSKFFTETGKEFKPFRFSYK